MSITKLELIPYDLELKRPINLTPTTESLKKNGYFLKSTIGNKSLISDVPYMPRFTPGPLMDIPTCFVPLKHRLLGKGWSALRELKTHPSLAFAFDSLQLFSTFSPMDSKTFVIKKNVLLDIHSEKLRQEVEKLPKGISEAVKIKVGRGNITEEAKRVKIVIQCLSRPIRLDANQNWKEKECLDFLSQLGAQKKWIEYLEEPLKAHYGLVGLKKLFATTGVPYALDEGFRDLYQKKKIYLIENYFNKGLEAIVIKPSLGPSLSACEQLINQYKTKIKWVISSAFESDLGLLALGYFIKKNALIKQVGGHGLDTYQWIKYPFLKTPILETKNGLEFPIGKVALREELLI